MGKAKIIGMMQIVTEHSARPTDVYARCGEWAVTEPGYGDGSGFHVTHIPSTRAAACNISTIRVAKRVMRAFAAELPQFATADEANKPEIKSAAMEILRRFGLVKERKETT